MKRFIRMCLGNDRIRRYFMLVFIYASVVISISSFFNMFGNIFDCRNGWKAFLHGAMFCVSAPAFFALMSIYEERYWRK